MLNHYCSIRSRKINAHQSANGKLPALFKFSISATTPRQGEIDGQHYHFLSSEAFHRKAQANNLFSRMGGSLRGLFYGTLRSEVTQIQRNGGIPLFDIDVNGGLSLQQKIDPKR